MSEMVLGATCVACGRALNTANRCPHCSGFTFTWHGSASQQPSALLGQADEYTRMNAEIERLRAERDALKDWQRRAVVELTLAQYRLRDHPDQDGFNNMRALIEEASRE